jgi:hypothetical protein
MARIVRASIPGPPLFLKFIPIFSRYLQKKRNPSKAMKKWPERPLFEKGEGFSSTGFFWVCILSPKYLS